MVMWDEALTDPFAEPPYRAGVCDNCGTIHIECGRCLDPNAYDTGRIKCGYCSEIEWEISYDRDMRIRIRQIT
jgi:Zn finger protein HypA/HybF involved in hydrogenase expression